MSASQRDDLQRFRVMGLRAIMDGRGLAASLLTSAPSVAFYGRGEGALVITAADCVSIPVQQARSRQFWTAVATAVGSAHAVGYEGDDLDPQQVAQLSSALGQRRVVDLAADILHHRMQGAPGM